MELRLFTAALLAATWAAAQGPEAGAVEVGGGAGAILDGGIHGAVGAGAGIATTRHLMLGFEFWHIPLGSAGLTREVLEPSRFPRTDSRALDLNANLQILIPASIDRARPYAVVGIGLLRWSQTVAGARYDGTDFRAGFGGGFRWYLGERWGVRPEFRVYVPERTFVRTSVTVFYQSR